MPNDPLVTIRLDAKPAGGSGGGAPSAPAAASNGNPDRTVSRSDASEERAKEFAKEQRAEADAQLDAYRQRWGAHIQGKGGDVASAAGSVMGAGMRAASKAALVAPKTAAAARAGLATAAPAVAIFAGVAKILESVPGMVLGFVEGATGLSIDSSVADGMGRLIRDKVSAVEAAFAASDTVQKRAMGRLHLGADTAVSDSLGEFWIFQAIEERRRAWRKNLTADNRQRIAEGLGREAFGRSDNPQSRSPGAAPPQQTGNLVGIAKEARQNLAQQVARSSIPANGGY